MSNEEMIYRKVRVRATIEYEIPVWDNWKDKKMVEAYLNEYTRCHDHMIEEIEGLITEDGGQDGKLFCLCAVSKYEYLGEVEGSVDTGPEVR